jgi:catechol 2,3-dioxygenase-like lactoylglutathione lyase family enzyme
MLTNSKAFSSFSVDDVKKAKEFYEQVLGLSVSEESWGTLKLHLAGGNNIFVYPKKDHVPATFTVLNFPVDDIEACVDELAAKGVKFEHYDKEVGDMSKTNAKGISESDGVKMAWFKDPARNFMALMQS